jgi:hypothetical protein
VIQFYAACQTSFAAGIHSLGAVFTSDFVRLLGSERSEGPLAGFRVEPGSTATALQASSVEVNTGASVTYTATVTPSYTGPIVPSGVVEFLDEGKPIESCESQPLSKVGMAASAICQLTYATPSVHSITAIYAGDENFVGSTSPAQGVIVQLQGSENQPSGNGGNLTSTTNMQSGSTSSGTIIEHSSGGSSHVSTTIPSGKIVVVDHKVIVNDYYAALVRLRCPGSQACSGKLTLFTHKRAIRRHSKRSDTVIVTLGTANFSIAPGKTALVKIRFSSAGRALWRARHGQVNASLTISYTAVASH